MDIFEEPENQRVFLDHKVLKKINFSESSLYMDMQGCIWMLKVVTLGLCEAPTERQPSSLPWMSKEQSSLCTGADVGRKRAPPTRESRPPRATRYPRWGQCAKRYKSGMRPQKRHSGGLQASRKQPKWHFRTGWKFSAFRRVLTCHLRPFRAGWEFSAPR